MKEATQNSKTTTIPLSEIKLGQAIEPSTGLIVGAYEGTEAFKTAAIQQKPSKIIPGGITWHVIKDTQDLKIEIAGQLQLNLNATVNLTVIPQYLKDLRAGEQSFSVVLKWTSDALQYDMSEPEFTAALAAKSADPPKPALPATPNQNYIFAGFTERAWTIGIWQITKVLEAKPEDFAELRLKISKYFLDPRRVDEGCDFCLTTLKAAKSIMKCEFRM